MQNNRHQNGNALWFILVAISLLGLLTIMMSRSSSTSNETGNYEQNIIKANEVLSYAKSVENAVQGLLARGCSENEISFWDDSDGNGIEDASDTYFNINSPDDRSCHIFNAAGAGLNYITPKRDWLDLSAEGSGFNFGTFVFSSTNTVTNLENNRDELIILLEWLNQSTCQAINNILFSETTITEDPASFSYAPSATGSFDTVADDINLSSYGPHNGQNSACFSSQTEGGFHFYHALITR